LGIIATSRIGVAISMLLDGRKLKWDVATETILNDDRPTQMLGRPFRAPWKLA
jgi:hypothetical protein